jgi:hypothetical protein
MKVRVLDSAGIPVSGLARGVQLAVEAGLESAAVLDIDGKPLAVAGALDDDEARAVAAVVTRKLRSPDLLARMLEGEVMSSSLDDREVRIGIAARCVFVVAVVGPDAEASLAAVTELHSDVTRAISEARSDFSGSPRPASPPPGGSSSGPAELPVVEIGVTVPRRPTN